ncbi:MAG: nucleotidyltransferase family protein [Novosphingobium sp.]
MSVVPRESKRALLTLLGGGWPERAPLPGEWPAITAMAAQHRLEPLLAYRLDHGDERWPVPAEVADAWRAAQRAATLASLAQQAALRRAGESLAVAGIAFAALKGARLAWRDYPQAALRPMRDLDLLVPPSDILPAAEALRSAGFVMPGGGAAAVSEALARDKHLPVLWHPELGVAIELHHRLVDPPARRSYHMPQLDPAAVLARAEPQALAGAAVLCPAPADLLAHLMVHALYGHRLDCGPLVLADIHFLLRGEGTIDWARFWSEADRQGWGRGGALLLALTARHFGPQPAPAPSGMMPPPAAIYAAAEEALLPDLAARDQAETLADLLAARSLTALAGAFARRLAPDDQVVASEGGGRARWRFWPVWAARRLWRLVTRLANRRTMREARGAATVIRWLKS